MRLQECCCYSCNQAGSHGEQLMISLTIFFFYLIQSTQDPTNTIYVFIKVNSERNWVFLLAWPQFRQALLRHLLTEISSIACVRVRSFLLLDNLAHVPLLNSQIPPDIRLEQHASIVS